jgi:hypothetical protein
MSESHYLNAEDFQRSVYKFGEIVATFTQAVEVFADAVDSMPYIDSKDLKKLQKKLDDLNK